MEDTSLNRKPVVLCAICGGIAACKAVEAVSQLRKQGFDVHVVMSDAAREFVKPLTFQAITGRKVITALFPPPDAEAREEIYPHLYPATEADVFVVLPATADVIGKIAHGYGDDLVPACALALPATAMRFFCPAMNSGMWEQDVVRRNVEKLTSAGWFQIGPASGALACGSEGEGRMSEPADIASRVAEAVATRNAFSSRRALVLSGPTHEHIDPVRFISNASSGRMGKAIAEELLLRGADVDFVTGPVADSYRPRGLNLNIYPVVSADDMLAAARRLLERADLIVLAAAVADYAPEKTAESKMPKADQPLTLTLKSTPDIAAALTARRKPGQVFIGFALQDADGERLARAKMINKGLDGIVLNTLDAMNKDSGLYSFLSTDDEAAAFDNWGRLTKSECARKILDHSLKLLR